MLKIVSPCEYAHGIKPIYSLWWRKNKYIFLSYKNENINKIVILLKRVTFIEEAQHDKG